MRDSEAERRYGEENAITPRTKKSIYETAAFEMRRGDPVHFKQTRENYKQNRKRERIEYDRTHFAWELEKQCARFSDDDKLWSDKQLELDAKAEAEEVVKDNKSNPHGTQVQPMTGAERRKKLVEDANLRSVPQHEWIVHQDVPEGTDPTHAKAMAEEMKRQRDQAREKLGW
jgi:hypothetical protein